MLVAPDKLAWLVLLRTPRGRQRHGDQGDAIVCDKGHQTRGRPVLSSGASTNSITWHVARVEPRFTHLRRKPQEFRLSSASIEARQRTMPLGARDCVH